MIGSELKRCKSKEEVIVKIKEYMSNGELRYINAETGINVLPEFEDNSLNIDMNLENFEERKNQLIERQNEKLQALDPRKIKAYILLNQYRKNKNSIELNGSFRKDLSDNKTEEEIKEARKPYEDRLVAIEQEARELLGENFSDDSILDRLEQEANEVEQIIQETQAELERIAEEVGLKLNTCIYTSPEQLADGKLQTSKDVLNIRGELGNWVFASSSTVVDNGYLLRRPGMGVMQIDNVAIPGDPKLISSKDGRAVLSTPAYVYLMDAKNFEPVVGVDYNSTDEPVIRFEGEWTSDKDVEKFETVKVSDVTEMLDYLQLFSPVDRETYMQLADVPHDQLSETIKKLIDEGKIHYINGECSKNIDSRFLRRPVVETMREVATAFAKDPKAQVLAEAAQDISTEEERGDTSVKDGEEI